MKIQFAKYQALGNDFLVVESAKPWTRAYASKVVPTMCARRTGIGADGVLLVSPSRIANKRVDVFNADGGWAEKSGNGLRIAAVHLARKRKSAQLHLEMGGQIDEVVILGKSQKGLNVRADLGKPEFKAVAVPVKSRHAYMVNRPLRVGKETVQVTCLAVGNPHAVIVVKEFDFDWRKLGAEIEKHRAFPNGTNVEFVRVLSKSKIRVAEWERGAGATGSSGTGAAAAVAACVTLGLVNRKCEVQFEPGSLYINWQEASGTILLTGPVSHVMSGTIEVK